MAIRHRIFSILRISQLKTSLTIMNTDRLTHRLAGTIAALMLFTASCAAFGAISPASIHHGIDATPSLPTDLVDERPSAIGAVWGYSTQAIGWVWGGLRDNVFSWISPPSPTSLTQSISKPDAIQLFKLLGQAGYKLKEIDTDVGIIPGLNFKFGQVRELSEADSEYLDTQVEEWEKKNPGFYNSIQRRIVKTVIAVNVSGEYRVSTLKVKLLPLPDVAFTMTPKKVFLGEEGSTIMGAIQRVERSVRMIGEEPKK
jgi:hypothetical protein